ncbi:uncharacterized protein LOC127129745 [Lathyrus oleraceus]|uniref:uncharacterized protein LOC127129745 n=1 Tax=Pisum sativum TaxID=3888 RepID=UPI0021CF06DD|nr:uncharacterized protein LOC127129745 [Pisum sativum]
MSNKTPKLVVVPISEVEKLKKVIKVLKKENDDLSSNIGKLTLEKENLKLNLNQKRERVLKAVEEFQAEQNKKRKMGEALKGTYDSLSTKKKQLDEAQYQASNMEINSKDQLRKLQDQLENCKKELKEEQGRAKQLEVSLSVPK